MEKKLADRWIKILESDAPTMEPTFQRIPLEESASFRLHASLAGNLYTIMPQGLRINSKDYSYWIGFDRNLNSFYGTRNKK